MGRRRRNKDGEERTWKKEEVEVEVEVEGGSGGGGRDGWRGR